ADNPPATSACASGTASAARSMVSSGMTGAREVMGKGSGSGIVQYWAVIPDARKRDPGPIGQKFRLIPAEGANSWVPALRFAPAGMTERGLCLLRWKSR